MLNYIEGQQLCYLREW